MASRPLRLMWRALARQPGTLNPPRMAAKDLAAVIAFVEASEGATPKLVGYSFGAIVVLRTGLLAPKP